MREAIPPLPQYAVMVWCSVIAQGQFNLLLHEVTSLPKAFHIMFWGSDEPKGRASIPSRERGVSDFHQDQIGCGAHPPSCPVVTKVFSAVSKAPGA
jgi:hypothetical protein